MYESSDCFRLQEQVQSLRCDNIALANDLAEARAAMSAQAEHAQRFDAQLLQQEASLHVHLEEAKRGLATAQQHAEEAREERDFFMAESTKAAALAASATAERDAAKQVCSYLMEIAMSHNTLTSLEYINNQPAQP